MIVRQWSDHVFAAYVGVTDRPFSGTFVGTESTWDAAQALALQRMCEDGQAGGAEFATGPHAPPGALDRRHLIARSEHNRNEDPA